MIYVFFATYTPRTFRTQNIRVPVSTDPRNSSYQ